MLSDMFQDTCLAFFFYTFLDNKLFCCPDQTISSDNGGIDSIQGFIKNGKKIVD